MSRKLRWMPAERRAEVRGDVGADREERHVAEVEQPGEADDDVQAERHDHVGRGQDHVAPARRCPASRNSGRSAAAARPRGSARRALHADAACGAGSRRGSWCGCRRSTSRTTPPSGSWSGRRTRTRTGGSAFMRAQSPASCASWRIPSSVATAPSTPPRAGSSAVRPSSSTATVSVPRRPRRAPRKRVRLPRVDDRSARIASRSSRSRAASASETRVAGRDQPLLAQPRLRLLRRSRSGPSRAGSRGCGC